jgi:putative DNA primase/helicase
MLQKMYGCTFKETVKMVEDALGIDGSKPPSREQREAYRRKLADERARREKQEAEQHRKAAVEAQRRWDAATPASANHPYLKAKGIKPYGIRQKDDDLIVPVSVGGTISSLQSIAADGSKKFQPGGKIKAGFFAIPGCGEHGQRRIIIAEGFATAATIREATGHSVAVAFNAGNLKPVAESIRASCPDAQIIIAADNDHKTEGNPGLTKGKAAADAVQGVMIYPEFTADESGSDWNDYAAIHGLDPVRKLFPLRNPLERDIVRLDSVAPEKIHWLWPGIIAIGKIAMLIGDPGLGKSLVTVMVAAHVTTGRPWPVNGYSPPTGSVLILSAEDDLADTIRPRLDAVGADVSKVYALTMVTEKSHGGDVIKRMPSMEKDLYRLDQFLNDHPDINLVIIDPVSSYLGGTDSHRNTDVRAVLGPWAELASQHSISILCVTHLNKGAGSAIYRASGSIAFIAAARTAFAVTKDKTDEARRLVVPVKSNISLDKGGMAYRISVSDGVPFADFENEPVDISADDALSLDSNDGDKTAHDEAIDWIRELLSDEGIMNVTDIKASASAAGLAWRTVQRASKPAGVLAKRYVIEGKVLYRWTLSDVS